MAGSEKRREGRQALGWDLLCSKPLPRERLSQADTGENRSSKDPEGSQDPTLLCRRSNVFSINLIISAVFS